MTMTRRRSNLSASAPATGPSSSGGSSFVATTPPSAKLCAWYPLVSWVARAERARRLIQSHTPATEVTSQSRRNAGMARTARTRCAVGADGGGTGVLMAAHLLGGRWSVARQGRPRPRQIPVQPCRIDQTSWMRMTR